MDNSENSGPDRKSPTAPEEAGCGANRVLTDVAAETLAFATKQSSNKRKVHVLLTGTPEFGDFFSDVIRLADERLEQHFDFHFHPCVLFKDISATLENHKCDFALVQLHRTPPSEWNLTDKREILLRAQTWQPKDYLCWLGFDLAYFLQSVHGIPVVMVSDAGGDEKAEAAMAMEVGANALFQWCRIDVQAFGKILWAILDQMPCLPDQRALPRSLKTRLPVLAEQPLLQNSLGPRVVLVEDDPDLVEFYVETFQGWFGQAQIVAFCNPLKALEELEAREPDLLITGDRMPRMGGEELVQRLMVRNIKYPILLLTANRQARQWVEAYAHQGFAVRYHEKPGSDEELLNLKQLVERMLQKFS